MTTMTLDITTVDRLRGDVFLQYPDAAEAQNVFTRISVWLTRGDQVLVYENRDLGSLDIGTHIYLSYGSTAAQLDTELFPEPPTTMPSLGALIGWRYQLVGVVSDD